jgi:DNA-binding MarR family transcriptional regulator
MIVYTIVSMKSPRPSAAATEAPRGCTSFKLRQLTRRVASVYDAELAAVGLKTTQYSLLSHVLRLGPVAPGALARAMTMDASTLTRNLKPLLAGGWVVLRPGADGRTRSVEITDAGRDKRAQAQRRWRVAQDSLQAVLGADRVAALHALLDDALSRLDPPPPGPHEVHDEH